MTGGDYYCLARYSTLGKNVGEVSTCNWTENITTDETMSNLTGWLNSGDFNKVKWARADIWRLCGVMMLGPGFTGRLDRIMPFTLIQHQDMKLAKWEKRSTPSGSFDDRVYIDNIGVPRGVGCQMSSKQEIRS